MTTTNTNGHVDASYPRDHRASPSTPRTSRTSQLKPATPNRSSRITSPTPNSTSTAKHTSPSSPSSSSSDLTPRLLLLPPSTLYRQLSTLLTNHVDDSPNPNPNPNDDDRTPNTALAASYSAHLARYLRGDISKCEFQSYVLTTLPRAAIALHNALVLALLRSVLTVPPPPPPPPPTPPRAPSSPARPPAASASAPATGGGLVDDKDTPSARLDAHDYFSHPLPFPRKRRLPESTDARRGRTRKEAVALPKEDRDRLRRELMAMDPESATAGGAGTGEGGEGGGEGAGKKKKKSKRAAAAAAAAAAALGGGEAGGAGGPAGAAGGGAPPNPFTQASTSTAAGTVPGLGPGLDLFGDAPLHGYAYPPTPPPSTGTLSSASTSPDPTAAALPLIATSRARHAEYMRLVHSMHICRVQGDLPGVPQLLDRLLCVMWETPGGKVEKVGPGVVELMMFGLRTYLKEVVEGMVRVGRIAEREDEVEDQVAQQAQAEEEHGVAQEQQADMDVDVDVDEEKEHEAATTERQAQEQDEPAPPERSKKPSSAVTVAALALLTNGDTGQVQSWSARPATSRPRSVSISEGSSGGGGGKAAAPWTARPGANGTAGGPSGIRRPSSFTAITVPPNSSSSSAVIPPPLDSPTTASSASLNRTPSTRSITSSAAPTQPPLAPPMPHADSLAVPGPRAPLAPRDRVLTLNHLATALALEPVLAGDARHVPDRVLAKLWHATHVDEQVAKWRWEMRQRAKARDEEAEGVGGE